MINTDNEDLNMPPLFRMSYADKMVYMWISSYPVVTTLKEYAIFLFHEQNTIRKRIAGTLSLEDIDQYCAACNTFLDAIYKLKINPFLKTDGELSSDQYRKAEMGTEEGLDNEVS